MPALQHRKQTWYLHSQGRTQGPPRAVVNSCFDDPCYVFTDSRAFANGLAIWSVTLKITDFLIKDTHFEGHELWKQITAGD